MMLGLSMVLIGSTLIAVLVGWALLRFEHLHSRFSHDHQASGPQKFHDKPTPRIGGVPIAAGFVAGLAIAVGFGLVAPVFAGALCLSILPAYASGLVEDVTKKIGPDIRLWASFLSALVAVFFFNAAVSHSGIPGIDALLGWYPLALILTTVGVGGVAHALNIIDGYNGLAGGVTCMMLAALGIVAWQVGDIELTITCVALTGATLGFLRWNFPFGQIFAGDGGAYLWGVGTAIVSILLVARNPQVPAWFPLAVVIYPVFETVFSIYRRKLKHAAGAGQPDAKHLHQLVFRRLLSINHAGGQQLSERGRTLRNAAAAPFLWTLAACAIVPAVIFAFDFGGLVAVIVGFCVIYVWLYRAIVRSSTPRMLRRFARRSADWVLAQDANQPTEQHHPQHRPVLVGNGDHHSQ